MRLRWLCLLLFFLPAWGSPFAQASASKSGRGQSTAAKPRDARTLDETFQWVKQQMEFSGSSHDVSFAEKGYNWHRVTSYANLQLHDCELSIDKTTLSNGRQREVHYTIPLWDLASATYQLDEGNKQFKYTPTVPALFFRNHTKSMHWGRPGSYVATDVVEIEFGRDPGFGRDKMEQLAKGVQHLGELCASQKPAVSEDESAKPAASNETEPN